MFCFQHSHLSLTASPKGDEKSEITLTSKDTTENKLAVKLLKSLVKSIAKVGYLSPGFASIFY